MNTKFLNTLLLVHKHGSMAEAGRRLNLTHGAVAQQIRALESELKVALVTRAGHTVHLTEAGMRILDKARDIQSSIDELTALAKSDEVRGELRLGAGNTSLHSVVPYVLARLVNKHPQVNVTISPGYSADFYPADESKELDAALATQAPYALPKSLNWHLLRAEPFVLLASQRHARHAPLDLLRRQPFIRYERNSWTGQMISRYLKGLDIQPRERFELNSLESIALMVHLDLGVAIVPLAANLMSPQLRIAAMPLGDYGEPRRFGLIWSRSSPKTGLIRAFLDAAQVEYQAYAAAALVERGRGRPGRSPSSGQIG
jgi:DNA-binding transcriptional LysR family regulator